MNRRQNRERLIETGEEMKAIIGKRFIQVTIIRACFKKLQILTQGSKPFKSHDPSQCGGGPRNNYGWA